MSSSRRWGRPATVSPDLSPVVYSPLEQFSTASFLLPVASSSSGTSSSSVRHSLQSVRHGPSDTADRRRHLQPLIETSDGSNSVVDDDSAQGVVYPIESATPYQFIRTATRPKSRQYYHPPPLDPPHTEDESLSSDSSHSQRVYARSLLVKRNARSRVSPQVNRLPRLSNSPRISPVKAQRKVFQREESSRRKRSSSRRRYHPSRRNSLVSLTKHNPLSSDRTRHKTRPSYHEQPLLTDKRKEASLRSTMLHSPPQPNRPDQRRVASVRRSATAGATLSQDPQCLISTADSVCTKPSISNEDLRRSFREKLEAFKAMERQSSLTTPNQTASRRYRPDSKVCTPAAPEAPQPKVETLRRVATTIAEESNASRNSPSKGRRPRASSSSTSSIMSENREAREGHLSHKSHEVDEVGSSGSTWASAKDKEKAKRSATDNCPACEALKRADGAERETNRLVTGLRNIDSRLIGVTKCVDASLSLEAYFRKKHPYAHEIAEEAKLLREQLAATCSPIASRSSFVPSPATTATPSGANVMFSSLAKLLTTPFRQPSSATPAVSERHLQRGLHQHLLRSHSLAQTEDVTPTSTSRCQSTNSRHDTEVSESHRMGGTLDDQKRSLSRSAFMTSYNPSCRDMFGIEVNASPIPVVKERSWPDTTLPTQREEDLHTKMKLLGNDRQAMSPPTTARIPWQSLMGQDITQNDNNSTNAINDHAIKIAELPVPLSLAPAHLLSLLDLLVDQEEMLRQISNFTTAIVTELKSVDEYTQSLVKAETETAQVQSIAKKDISCGRHAASPQTPKRCVNA